VAALLTKVTSAGDSAINVVLNQQQNVNGGAVTGTAEIEKYWLEPLQE
jgi:hypothetical protein